MKNDKNISIIPNLKACPEYSREKSTLIIVHDMNHETIVNLGNVTKKMALDMLEAAKFLLLQDIFSE